MAFDGIAVHSLVREFNDLLIDGRVDKINQPEKDEICIQIRAKGVNNKLLISASPSTPRVHLVTITKENPQKAPMFCMLLRKHVQSGRILGFRQPTLERIMFIDIECRNEMGDLSTKTIVVEIMGKHSNIILVDDENKILGSVKHVDFTVSRMRQVLPGMLYEMPPTQNKLNPKEVTVDTVKELISHCDKASDEFLLDSFVGISPIVAREISAEALGDTSFSMENMDNLSVSIFANFIVKYFQNVFTNPAKPLLLYKDTGKIFDFSTVEINQYKTAMTKEYVDCVSQAIEKLYFTKDYQERFSQKIGDLLRFVETNIARCEKKLQLQFNKLGDCAKKDKHKLYGDLLMANLYKLSDGKVAEVENYYDENKIISVPLNENLTVNENAQRYYKLYQKAKTTEVMTKVQIEKSQDELHYLESVLNNILDAENLNDIGEIREELNVEGYTVKRDTRKKSKKQSIVTKPLEFEVEDYVVCVGKNNLQNDILTLKTASNSDIWLHTKDFPSAHVVIKTKGTTPPEAVIMEAARLCASHSKAKNSQNVPVDYTEIRNVKKPKGAKAGMVIYDNYNTVYVTPIENN